MTPEQLNELERLANAATPGPWFEKAWHTESWSLADAHFIAAARTAVPDLIAEVRRLKRLINQDVPCQPACDSYGHADDCAYVNFDVRLANAEAEVRRLTEEWALSAQTGLAEIEALRAENAALQAAPRTPQP